MKEAYAMINTQDLISWTQSLIDDSTSYTTDTAVRMPYVVNRKRFYNDNKFVGCIETCATWGYIRIEHGDKIKEINLPSNSFAELIILESYIHWMNSSINKLIKKDALKA